MNSNWEILTQNLVLLNVNIIKEELPKKGGEAWTVC